MITIIIIVLIVIVAVLIAVAFIAKMEERSYTPRRTTALVPLVKKDFELSYDKFERMLMQELGYSELETRPALREQYQDLFDFYNPNGGWISGWFAQKRTAKQLEVASNLNHIQKILLDNISAVGRDVMARRKEAGAFFTEMQRNYAQLREMKTQIEFAEQAASAGMLPDRFSDLNYETAIKHVRVAEYAEKAQIDLDRDIQEAQEAVRLAMLSKEMGEHQKIMVLQDAIDLIYDQIDGIERSSLSDWIKQAKIGHRMDIIQTFQEDRRVRQNRLLQANHQEETKGYLQAAKTE